MKCGKIIHLPTLQRVPANVMSDREWTSSSLGRSWSSIDGESLSSSFSLPRNLSSKLRSDNRLSNSLGASDWVNFKKEKNATTLAEAIKKGRVRHVQLLLEAGTDPNDPDESGFPALVTAVVLLSDKGSQEKLIKLLLKYGADPNLGDNRGTTPLMHAARVNRHDAALNLLHHGITIDPGLQDNDGNSALMYAAAFGRTEIALLILSTFRKLHHLTYISQRNAQGFTAIELAEQNGHESLALLLNVESDFAPRPSGPSSFIPSTCDLDRPPTPTEDLDIGKEEQIFKSSSNFLNKVKRLKEFKVTSPSAEEQKVLDHLSRGLDLSSSPGSGNEADTESLMEGEKLTVEDLDNCDNEMAAPSAAFHTFTSHSSDVVQRDLFTNPVHQSKLSSSLSNISNIKSSSIRVMGAEHLKKGGLSASAAALLAAEGMPKINMTPSQTMNKNIKGLVQEDVDLRPGQRPPTPARQSLPTLLPNRLQDIPLNCSISSTKSDGIRNQTQFRRVTLSSMQRSSTESNQMSNSPRMSSEEEVIDTLDVSTKSEGWDHIRSGRMSRGPSQMQCYEGHVVPLPPISQSRKLDIGAFRSKNDGMSHKDDSVLSVAKKTLEKLEIVLAPDNNSENRIPRSRTHDHLHLTS